MGNNEASNETSCSHLFSFVSSLPTEIVARLAREVELRSDKKTYSASLSFSALCKVVTVARECESLRRRIRRDALHREKVPLTQPLLASSRSFRRSYIARKW
jgi:hypothetical protein